VNIPPSVLAELALLSDVLDSPSFDISETLSRLVADVAASLPSFIGISILVGDPETRLEVTTIENSAQAARIRTSLRFPLREGDVAGAHGGASGELIVFAAQPGALVDLAADLAWLTRLPLADARLDEDLGGPDSTSRERSLSRLSTINQALGVLMGGGLTQEESVAELATRAEKAGLDRHLVAAEILASLPGPTAAS